MMPPKTKEWNYTTEQMKDDDSLYTDYKDPEKTETTNYKFRSQPARLKLWIQAHRIHSDFLTARWETKSSDVVTLRTGPNNRSLGSIVVKFHLGSNIVVIQGKAMDIWKTYYPELKSTVNNLEINEPPVDMDEFISGLQSESRPVRMSQCGALDDHDTNDSLEIEDDDPVLLDPSIYNVDHPQNSEKFDHDNTGKICDTSVSSHTVISQVDSDGKSSKKPVSLSPDVGHHQTVDDSQACLSDVLQKQYINVIDGNNRYIESMSLKLEEFQKQVNKSITELCKCMHSVKSESVENMEAILSTIEQHHNDNNQFSSRIADLNEKMLRMQELITRYKDENYQIKSINAELVSENTHLKARNVKPVKNVNASFPFRSAVPVITASPSRTRKDAKCQPADTSNDEAIARAMGAGTASDPEQESEFPPILNPFSTDRTHTAKTPSQANRLEYSSFLQGKVSGTDKCDQTDQMSSSGIGQHESSSKSGDKHSNSTDKHSTSTQSVDDHISLSTKPDKTNLSSKGGPVTKSKSPGRTESEPSQARSSSPERITQIVSSDYESVSSDSKSSDSVSSSSKSPVSQVNLNNSTANDDVEIKQSDDVNDVFDDFSVVAPGRHQNFNMLLKSETVLIHDSTPKHVDMRRFMGRLQAYSQRASTTGNALKIVKSWPTSNKVKYATVHDGVNDVTDGTQTDTITNNLKCILTVMRNKFPNAKVSYSEILFIGRDNRQSTENQAIEKINGDLREFCDQENFTYIPHASLQSPSCKLFNDQKHINETGGTAVFVSDIYYATEYRKKNDRTSASTFYNSSRVPPANNRGIQKPTFITGKVNGDGISASNGDTGMKELLQMMCLSQQALVNFLSKA